MTYVSRRKLAQYVADELIKGDDTVMSKLAAFLVSERRTHEADIIIRDIYSALESKKLLVARVRSATTLSDTDQAEICHMLESRFDASRVELSSRIEPELMGGVIIETAEELFDASLLRNLNKLRAMKV